LWNGDEFKHLTSCNKNTPQNHMFLFIPLPKFQSLPSSPINIEKISQFVMLCTVATAVIAPLVAILGLTYFFMS
jgi:hypothetical protein